MTANVPSGLRASVGGGNRTLALGWDVQKLRVWGFGVWTGRYWCERLERRAINVINSWLAGEWNSQISGAGACEASKTENLKHTHFSASGLVSALQRPSRGGSTNRSAHRALSNPTEEERHEVFPGSRPQGRSGGSKGERVSSGSNQSSEGSVRARVPVSPTGLCAVRKCTHSFPVPGHSCAWNPGQWVKRDRCKKNVLSAREEGLPSQRGPAEARHLFRGKQEPCRKGL